MKKSTGGVFISAVCAVLAILLLGLTLMTEIRLSRLEDENRSLQSEREELTRSNRIARVRLLERLPLEELERYATENMGMQRQRSAQIIVVEDGA